MKFRYATPLFCLALLASAPSRAEMKVKKLAEGVWASTTTNGANVGWFVNGDEVIAVDGYLRALGRKFGAEPTPDVSG